MTVILTGAALIREREQGTVEHLLVMPVVPSEIMLAKMIANGLVILVAAMLSLQFVVHWWIGSPINGSLLLFLLGAAIYALVVAALVVVFDKTIADEETLRDIRGRIAYMPQGLGRNLYPTLSVFENIDFFGRLFGLSATERRAKIDELLTATSLEKFEARPAGKLSGGMKQKLSLCCALINDPDLLILDEPTTGVDPLSRGQFWDLINTIRARRPQMSVIVATAYMDEAERFDWLMAMDDGKIIATGTLKELLAKTGEPNLDDAFIAHDARGEARPAQESGRASARRLPGRDAGDRGGRAHARSSAISSRSTTSASGFRRGEIFGFLGSNGCGKSTTMKMLVGFLPATQRHVQAVRRADGLERHAGPAQRRIHDAGLFALRRTDGRAESPAACRALSFAEREDRPSN